MSIQPVWPVALDLDVGRPISVEPSMAQLTSDAGLLPLRQFDAQLGLSAAIARALSDPRDPARRKHLSSELVRARLFGLLAGYEDQNDHDVLRHDPVMKLVAGRLPTDLPLASQPTHSRFENQVTIAALKRLRDVLLDQFLDGFDRPPGRLTFDLDAVDDPAHGEQQLVLFHGYYEQHQYLPLFISNAETGLFVSVALRPGNVHAALGADDDLEYVVARIRQRWPDVAIAVRGDCAFGVPAMYAVCERLGVTYTFGLAANRVLQAQIDELLAEATRRYQQTGQPQRLFTAFTYQAKSWAQPRHVVAKAECHAVGTNRRFVVSNRPGAPLLPEGTYDEYVMRGESENRNKEIKCGLAMDRLSDHRFCANYFRLYLHLAAHQLLMRLRRQIALPEPPSAQADLPTEALAGRARQQHQQRRRQHNRLGHGQPETWRVQLIKVAAEVFTSARRVVVKLAANWPFLPTYQRVCWRLATLRPRPSG